MCFFCSEIFVSSNRYISELMAPGFSRPMELIRGEVYRFRGLTVYVLDGFSAYRPLSWPSG